MGRGHGRSKRGGDQSHSRFRQFWGGVLLAGVLGSCSDGEQATAPRNVVLFVCDTLRADRLGCYGHERDTSPNVDALAANGRLYQRNYSQGCWTVPSMISMFSGRYVFDEEQALPDLPTLAEHLADASVYTAAFVGNDVLTGRRGFQRGFAEFHRPPLAGKRATRMIDFFQRWWFEQSADLELAEQRFFWFQAFDPHTPFEPDLRVTPSWSERADSRFYRERSRSLVSEARANVVEGSLDFAAAVRHMSADSLAYDGEVLGMDRGFGQLLEFLADQGELEDTLILFAADHGEKLYEHPLYPQEKQLKLDAHGGYPLGVADLLTFRHRAFFRDELWNTPLILQGPGVAPGVVVEELSSNLDLYPTICAAFGVEPPAGVEGRNLLAKRVPSLDRVHAYGFGTEALIEADGLKFISHDPERYLLETNEARPVELLDLRADPDEREDFAGERSGQVERLNGLLEDWRERVERPFVDVIDKGEEQALQALGYLDYVELPATDDASGEPESSDD